MDRLGSIKSFLDKNLAFLTLYLPLANAHASNFITEQQWERLVPEHVREELAVLTDEELKQLPMLGYAVADELHDGSVESEKSQSNNESVFSKKTDSLYGEYPSWIHRSVRDYCRDAWYNTIDGQGLAVTVEEMLEQLGVTVTDTGLFIPTYMNEKKSHEVDSMSEVCAQLSKCTQCKLVVDIGSGKGYLGQTLYLQQKLTVLGIDAVSTNTLAAERRLGIMGKQWEGLTRNLKNKQNDVILTKKQKKQLKQGEKKTQFVVKDQLAEKLVDGAKTNSNSKENLPHSSNINVSEHICSNTIENNENGSYVPLTMCVDTHTDLKTIACEAFPFLTAVKFTIDMNTEAHQDLEGKCQCQNSELNETTMNRIMHNASKTKPSSESYTEEHEHVGSELKEPPECIFHSSHSSCAVTKETRTSDSFGSQGNCDGSDFGMLLTGLHTCGNLASSMLELFVSNSDVRCLCSVGCCYHLLTEEFLQEISNPDICTSHCQPGFPQSSYLREKRVCLGNTARNLASQSVHKMVNSDELQGYRFYPRALLQKMVVDLVDPETVQWTGLRRLEKKTTGISDYIVKAWKKLGLSEYLLTEELIQMYLKQYENERQQLAAFFQLKAVLAPCIESLILLDKLYYLLEQDCVEDAFLVKMFDPYVSPRCYGIVAVKR